MERTFTGIQRNAEEKNQSRDIKHLKYGEAGIG